MKVGESNEPFDFFFDQAPCSWTQNYDVVVSSPDGSTGILPAFISIDRTFLIIDKPKALEIG